MRKYDLTSKKTMTKTTTMTMTMTKTMTYTFREHLQRAIFETFELWDIWSEWWGNMTWPTKRQQRRQTQWQWQKFRVWPLIHCYESDSSRPNWWGLTKFHNFRQISQFWPMLQFQPNFTILDPRSRQIWCLPSGCQLSGRCTQWGWKTQLQYRPWE